MCYASLSSQHRTQMCSYQVFGYNEVQIIMTFNKIYCNHIQHCIDKLHMEEIGNYRRIGLCGTARDEAVIMMVAVLIAYVMIGDVIRTFP